MHVNRKTGKAMENRRLFSDLRLVAGRDLNPQEAPFHVLRD
jgi:hypothetical protein